MRKVWQRYATIKADKVRLSCMRTMQHHAQSGLCTHYQPQDWQHNTSTTNGLGCKANTSLSTARLWRMQGYEILILKLK